MNKILAAFYLAIVSIYASFKRFVSDTSHAVLDVGAGIAIGVLCAALMVIAYIIWTLQSQLITTDSSNAMNQSILNVTNIFNNAILLIGIVITVALLALALLTIVALKKRAE